VAAGGDLGGGEVHGIGGVLEEAKLGADDCWWWRSTGRISLADAMTRRSSRTSLVRHSLLRRCPA
jgi:hypothetical protein